MINIGEYIYDRLSAKIQNAKIVPLVADNDTAFPYIVYKRIALTSNQCKDGFYEDHVTMQIAVVSDKYEESVDIANDVRDALEILKGTYDNKVITNCYLTTATENYSSGAYVQTLQFNMTINK